MSWTVCNAQPEYVEGWTAEIVAFKEQVDAWLDANRTGTTRCKVICDGRAIDLTSPSARRGPPFLQVKFRKKRDAVLFKMFFGDHIMEGNRPNWSKRARGPSNYAAYNNVILPIIRKVMPTVIAHDIIGSQNMVGPLKMDSFRQKLFRSMGLKIRRNTSTKTARVARRKKNTICSTKTSGTARKKPKVVAQPSKLSTMQQILENTRKELERWSRP